MRKNKTISFNLADPIERQLYEDYKRSGQRFSTWAKRQLLNIKPNVVVEKEPIMEVDFTMWGGK